MSDVTDRMQELGRTVETILPPNTGFVVLAFDLNTDCGRLEYVSNAVREDVVKTMKEFIAKTEGTGRWAKHL
jgi:hypothetical protein